MDYGSVLIKKLFISMLIMLYSVFHVRRIVSIVIPSWIRILFVVIVRILSIKIVMGFVSHVLKTVKVVVDLLTSSACD